MAEKIVGVYDIKVDKAISQLNELSKRVDKIDKDAKRSAKKTEDAYSGMASKLSSQFKSLAGTIGLAFGAQELVSFGKEAVKLASQMEGVERAFKRIGGANSANLLEGLRRATRGTVSDLQLMQKAVQASNFKIPLENLASLFKFAQARARETGESVEYLTNSIVLGIGRKSPLILDNLGISAVELRNRLKGVGVEASSVGDIAKIIGDIAEEELAKMGDQADTTADRIEQLNTVLKNTKVLIGEGLIEASELYLEAITPVADEAEKSADGIYSLAENTGYLNSVMKVGQRALEFSAKKYIDIKDSVILALQAVNGLGHEMSEAAYRLTLNNEELIEFNKLSEVAKDITVRRWMAQEDFNDLSEDAIRASEMYNKQLLQEQEGLDNYTRSINQLNSELKDLKKDFNDLEIGSDDWNQKVVEISQKTSELAAATTKAAARLVMFQQAARGFDPFAVDEFDDRSAEGIGLDLSSLDKENEAISEAIDDQVAIRRDGSDRIQDIVDEQLRASLEANDKELESAKKLAEDKARIREQEFQEFQMYVQAVGGLMSSISNLQASLVQEELLNLKAQLEAETITREEYEQKRKQILSQQAEDQKTFAIFEAAVNGALAVVNAFNQGGPVLAAVVAAGVAAQVAAIAAQPVPQFAEGGFVGQHGEIKGRKHSQGGVKIEAEGGEFITSAKYAQQNADILKAINSGEWEKYKMENIIAPAINQVLEGGFQGLGASYTLNAGFNDKNLLRAIDRHRTSDKDGFVYLANELKKLKPRKRGGFA